MGKSIDVRLAIVDPSDGEAPVPREHVIAARLCGDEDVAVVGIGAGSRALRALAALRAHEAGQRDRSKTFIELGAIPFSDGDVPRDTARRIEREVNGESRAAGMDFLERDGLLKGYVAWRVEGEPDERERLGLQRHRPAMPGFGMGREDQVIDALRYHLGRDIDRDTGVIRGDGRHWSEWAPSIAAGVTEWSTGTPEQGARP